MPVKPLQAPEIFRKPIASVDTAALPLLEALHGMLDDADIAYNYGICLSEMGRVEDALAPLERCVAIDATCTNAHVGLGVACARPQPDRQRAAACARGRRRADGCRVLHARCHG